MSGDLVEVFNCLQIQQLTNDDSKLSTVRIIVNIRKIILASISNLTIEVILSKILMKLSNTTNVISQSECSGYLLSFKDPNEAEIVTNRVNDKQYLLTIAMEVLQQEDLQLQQELKQQIIDLTNASKRNLAIKQLVQLFSINKLTLSASILS